MIPQLTKPHACCHVHHQIRHAVIDLAALLFDRDRFFRRRATQTRMGDAVVHDRRTGLQAVVYQFDQLFCTSDDPSGCIGVRSWRSVNHVHTLHLLAHHINDPTNFSR